MVEERDKKKELQPDIEIIDMCTPSPPKVSKVHEIEKSSNRQLLTIDTLLCPPGRLNRPSKIVIILRGLPGSGKSHVAKLIKVCLLWFYDIILLLFFLNINDFSV